MERGKSLFYGFARLDGLEYFHYAVTFPLGKIGAFLLVLIEYAIPYAMREGLRQYAINLGGFPSARIHNAVVA